MHLHIVLIQNVFNMNKTLETRVEELEKMVFMNKNVLSFEEASRFFKPLKELSLQTHIRQFDTALQAAR